MTDPWKLPGASLSEATQGPVLHTLRCARRAGWEEGSAAGLLDLSWDANSSQTVGSLPHLSVSWSVA